MKIIINGEDTDGWLDRLGNITNLVNEVEDVMDGKDFEAQEDIHTDIFDIGRFIELTNSALNMLLSKIKK